ncbi:hypothetical protein DWV07_06455 [Dickeya zeae]|nr:hypothetical protein DWV07_06455 [Dickeya zeae]
MVICFDLAIDQIAQSGLSSLKVIYYSAQLFRFWGTYPYSYFSLAKFISIRIRANFPHCPSSVTHWHRPVLIAGRFRINLYLNGRYCPGRNIIPAGAMLA